MTFTVTVRDHMMIAHSLSGDVFGLPRTCTEATPSSTRPSEPPS